MALMRKRCIFYAFVTLCFLATATVLVLLHLNHWDYLRLIRWRRLISCEHRVIHKTKFNVDAKDMIRKLTIQHFNPSRNFVHFSDLMEHESRCRNHRKCSTRTPLRHHRTCAIVGSGGILANSSCGNEIDLNDYVIRLNMAPTRNFEQDVGQKTNLTFVNVSLAKDLLEKLSDEDGRESVLQWMSSLKHGVISYVKVMTTEIKDVLQALGTVAEDNDFDIAVTYSLDDTQKAVTRVLGEKLIPELYNPTAGLTAYTLGTTFCDVITLYGFYPFATDARNRTLFYRYYDNYSASRVVDHDYCAEFDFLVWLNKLGAARLVTDACR
ncbi:alpha-2,8-sialyltransferase 8B-like isoform X1 [Branchiostoma lanceolatum]|uniref:alpha-2,8-sialyltransferase 8B-like isoform X1 n=2 Tax=Branchiostoma lanceolatum TaxID=7740 RepID=UPI003455592B